MCCRFFGFQPGTGVGKANNYGLLFSYDNHPVFHKIIFNCWLTVIFAIQNLHRE
jgi:hypothetical protein